MMMNLRKNNMLHALSFALVETVLYLDGHPNDRRAIEYYEKIKSEYRKALEEYERENGPVTAGSDTAVENGKWRWSTEPWPWQNDKKES